MVPFFQKVNQHSRPLANYLILFLQNFIIIPASNTKQTEINNGIALIGDNPGL